jgi:hypothetical protein
MAMLAKLLLCVVVGPRPVEASTWVGKKCQGEICDNPDYPILDWDGDKCVCRKHPCWEDNGKAHSCPKSEAPFLKFAYNADGTLVCSCSPTPHSSSPYVSHDLCPGQTCDAPTHPLLDFSDDKASCMCSSHPCANDNGKVHTCKKEDFPILTFSYKKNGELQCRCTRKYSVPNTKKDL